MITVPVIQPYRPTQLRSKLMFHWRARYLSLTAITGQAGVFTATATASADDAAGTPWTAIHSQPRWHQDADGQPTLRMTSRDQLYWPLGFLPREMTVYVEFIEQGTRTTSSARLFQIGHQTSVSTDPRFYVMSDGSQYEVHHDNGGTDRFVDVSPSVDVGDVVEVRAVLQADGGVEIGITEDGGAESTDVNGTAAALQSAWAGPYLHLNGVGGSNQGSTDFRVVKIANGDRSMAEMRSVF